MKWTTVLILLGEKNFPLSFFSCDLMNAFDFAKRLSLELVHHVWLSLRLDNLIVENKNNWAKNHIFLFLLIIVCSVCLSVYLCVCLFASCIFTLSGNKMFFLCEKWTKIHFVFLISHNYFVIDFFPLGFNSSSITFWTFTSYNIESQSSF